VRPRAHCSYIVSGPTGLGKPGGRGGRPGGGRFFFWRKGAAVGPQFGKAKFLAAILRQGQVNPANNKGCWGEWQKGAGAVGRPVAGPFLNREFKKTKRGTNFVYSLGREREGGAEHRKSCRGNPRGGRWGRIIGKNDLNPRPGGLRGRGLPRGPGDTTGFREQHRKFPAGGIGRGGPVSRETKWQIRGLGGPQRGHRQPTPRGGTEKTRLITPESLGGIWGEFKAFPPISAGKGRRGKPRPVWWESLSRRGPGGWAGGNGRRRVLDFPGGWAGGKFCRFPPQPAPGGAAKFPGKNGAPNPALRGGWGEERGGQFLISGRAKKTQGARGRWGRGPAG